MDSDEQQHSVKIKKSNEALTLNLGQGNDKQYNLINQSSMTGDK